MLNNNITLCIAVVCAIGLVAAQNPPKPDGQESVKNGLGKHILDLGKSAKNGYKNAIGAIGNTFGGEFKTFKEYERALKSNYDAKVVPSAKKFGQKFQPFAEEIRNSIKPALDDVTKAFDEKMKPSNGERIL